MRIIRASFANLNSLRGQWEVDFTHGDFRADGLFLISGPTGAGKTTLLDAISLALYGRTPRIDVISTSQNEIMSRQTGYCFSEVAFETSEGRFRARWEQRRARKSPDGNLQQPSHELSTDSGKILGSRLAETEKLVRRIIGLDYDQFIRAVLLAQNGFDAFLKADDDKKSAILEKLTDTSIYSDLSIFSQKKMRQAEAALEEAERRLRETVLLTREEEEEKLAKMAECQKRLAEIGEESAALQKGIAWRRNLAALKQNRAALMSDAKAVGNELGAFEPQRQKLARANEAAGLEALFAKTGGYRRHLADNAASLAKNLIELEKAEAGARLAETKQAQLDEDFRNRERSLAAARPILEKAMLMDAKIIDLGKRKKSNEMACADCDRMVSRQEDTLRNLRGNLERLQKQEEATAKWLDCNKAGAWLAENISWLRERCGQLEEIAAEAATQKKRLELEKKELASLSESLDNEKRGLDRECRKRDDCQARMSDIEERQKNLLAGWTYEGLKQALFDKRLLAERCKSFEEHRKNLEGGKPCPLCGSLEHPWQTDFQPVMNNLETECGELETRLKDIDGLSASLRQMEKSRDSAAASVERIQERIKGLNERLDSGQMALKQRQQDAKAASSRMDQARSQIRQALESVSLSGEIPDIMPMFEKRLEDWRANREKEEKIKANIQELRTRLDSGKDALEIAQKSARQTRQALEESALALEDAISGRQQILPGKDTETERQRLEKLAADAKAAARKNLSALSELREKAHLARGTRDSLTERQKELEPEAASCEAEFAAALAQKGFTEQEFMGARLSGEARESLAARLNALLKKQTELDALLAKNMQAIQSEESNAITQLEEGELAAKLRQCEEIFPQIHEKRARLSQEIEDNNRAKDKTAAMRAEMEARRREFEKWNALYLRIGSSDGKKFRAFAQSITLDRLLAHANQQLAAINPRYSLKRAVAAQTEKTKKGARNLDLEVIDHYQAGQIRSIKNLSGGESFMASLALALGLSAMAGKNAMLDSLFLDEGFGALDSDSLETAFAAISKLKRDGKLIGIISHVETLKDWIPTQITIGQNSGDPSASSIFGPGCRRLPE